MDILPIPPVAVLILAALLLYPIGKVVYRLYFHPLSSFPGPKLAAATFWYEVYFDVFKPPYGQFIYEIDRLHSIYGPVVRCNPEEIHVKDSEFFHVLFTGPGHVRDKWDRANRANGSPGSVASATAHDLHRIRRGALNPFFSKKAVTDLEKDTRRKVDSLCERLKEYARNGRTVPLGRACTAVTLDVISQYCFDACYNCVEAPEFAPEWQMLKSVTEGAPFAKQFPRTMSLMQSLPRSLAVKMNPDLKHFFACKDTIDEQALETWRAERNASTRGK